MSASFSTAHWIHRRFLTIIPLLIFIFTCFSRLSTAQRVAGSSVLQQILNRQHQNRRIPRRNPNGNPAGGLQQRRSKNEESATSTITPMEMTHTTDLPDQVQGSFISERLAECETLRCDNEGHRCCFDNIGAFCCERIEDVSDSDVDDDSADQHINTETTSFITNEVDQSVTSTTQSPETSTSLSQFATTDVQLDALSSTTSSGTVGTSFQITQPFSSTSSTSFTTPISQSLAVGVATFGEGETCRHHSDCDIDLSCRLDPNCVRQSAVRNNVRVRRNNQFDVELCDKICIPDDIL